MTTKKSGFFENLKRSLKVDGIRMLLTPSFYIVLGICFAVPILILVMTTMNAGEAGGELTMQGFENVWQIIGSLPQANAAGGGTDLSAICNINVAYVAVAVLTCLFISSDFSSGYAKNIFSIRATKLDYVLSKTLVCFASSALFLIAFFVGVLVGGEVSGLSFATDGFSPSTLTLCMLSKILLCLSFVSLFVLAGVIGKSKGWLSICLSLAFFMLLFSAIPALTPLTATPVNLIICLFVGVVVCVGLSLISKKVLEKTSLV